MSLEKSIKTFVISALFVLTAVPAMAQDLLARQAPVDRKMKIADTISMETNYTLAVEETMEEWQNTFSRHTKSLPESFKIDLTHFCMPTPSRVITSNFGARWGRMHKGLDIKVYVGDTIRAAWSGKVRIVKYEAAGYGKYVVIQHYNGLETIYAHMSKQLVREGETVRAGEPIGLGGNTGRSTGSHLHFETRYKGIALNPALMFDFRAQDVTGDYYVYNRRTYNRDSNEASRLRGKRGNGGYSRSEVVGTARADQEERVVSRTVASNMDNSSKQYHKVVAGETLYSISRTRGVSVDELCRLNNLSKTTKVRIGQIIRYS
ncbi:MAG: peptidoglycan DD-metalloendopeptidase family protein [Prevotella sp.]|nr:peptidoglycan DD-metalloendopeptidase family protein [Prevotella sp.]